MQCQSLLYDGTIIEVGTLSTADGNGQAVAHGTRDGRHEIVKSEDPEYVESDKLDIDELNLVAFDRLRIASGCAGNAKEAVPALLTNGLSSNTSPSPSRMRIMLLWMLVLCAVPVRTYFTPNRMR